jgi:DNA modification methylase
MPGDVRLTWEGKRPARLPNPLPELVPSGTRSCAAIELSGNLLIHGDNLNAMAALLPRFAASFDLIYLDPPFFTGRDFRSRPSPAGAHGASARKAQPRASESSSGFSDDWSGGLSAYLQWLVDRITAAHALLTPTGCLYLHLSWHSVHYAKLLLDEVFGVDRFENEIVWCYREAINSRKRWNRKHDTILFYSKGEPFTFNYDAVREPYSETTLKKFRSRDDKGPYRLMGRGITDSHLRSKRDLAPEMETLFPDLTYRHYLGEGTLPVDYWWFDIENQASKARTGYPTQKPEALLERILLASTNEGDRIGDFCCGSGTTLSVAHRLGRRWVGCDIGDHAIDTTRARLADQGAQFEQLTASE